MDNASPFGCRVIGAPKASKYPTHCVCFLRNRNKQTERKKERVSLFLCQAKGDFNCRCEFTSQPRPSIYSAEAARETQCVILWLPATDCSCIIISIFLKDSLKGISNFSVVEYLSDAMYPNFMKFY